MVHTTSDRVLGLDRRKEISRDELGALMNELVESVLAIRARCSPKDRLQANWSANTHIDEAATHSRLV